MRAVLILLWCLRWLPPRWVAAIGTAVGNVLFLFGRRRVSLINLRKCFPEKSEAERERIGRGVFQHVCRASLRLGRLWYAPPAVALSGVTLVGREHFERHQGHVPIIVFAPHFVGLDVGGAIFTQQYANVISMYSKQKSDVFDAALRRARLRFGQPNLITRQQGLRPILKGLKEQHPFYYLPDMDFGAKDAVFVDFFGVKTATVTALARLCEITGAKVVPLVTRERNGGYEAQFYPAWENYPSGNPEADARRMNAFLEERVLETPDQYFWVHKRFKTRPAGEAGFYD